MKKIFFLFLWCCYLLGVGKASELESEKPKGLILGPLKKVTSQLENQIKPSAPPLSSTISSPSEMNQKKVSLLVVSPSSAPEQPPPPYDAESDLQPGSQMAELKIIDDHFCKEQSGQVRYILMEPISQPSKNATKSSTSGGRSFPQWAWGFFASSAVGLLDLGKQYAGQQLGGAIRELAQQYLLTHYVIPACVTTVTSKEQAVYYASLALTRCLSSFFRQNTEAIDKAVGTTIIDTVGGGSKELIGLVSTLVYKMGGN